MFIGRSKELETLEKLYNQSSFQFVVIYGGRRIGKTTLINEFIKIVFYPGIDSNIKQNLELFSSSVLSSLTDIPANITFKDFEDIFEYIYHTAQNKHLILAIGVSYLAKCKLS